MTQKLPTSDLVVVIPGILGSVLKKNGKEIWGLSASSLLDNILSLGWNLNCLKLPGDIGHNGPGDGVVATRLMPALHFLPRFWKIDGYGDLIASLEHRFELTRSTPEQPGNFIEFPYDWRLSNVLTAKRLEARVLPELERWRRHAKNSNANLVLICHSMGGLIARWFLEVLGGRDYTRRLITIGTPYQGSINALETLVNGFRLSRQGPKLDELVRSFPSVYQLLPTYKCLDVGDGKLQSIDNAVLPEVASANVTEGLAFHSKLKAHVASNPKYVTHAIKGVVQPTSQSARLKDGAIEPIREINGLDRGGDGTVARPSAHPPEWPDDTQSIFCAQSHALLQRTDSILTQLGSVLAGRKGGWMSGLAQLGLDIPDVIDAGTELPVLVRSASNDPRLALQATCRSEAGEPVGRPILLKSRGDGIYDGAFRPERPGAYKVMIGAAVAQRPIEEVAGWTLVWDEHATRP